MGGKMIHFLLSTMECIPVSILLLIPILLLLTRVFFRSFLQRSSHDQHLYYKECSLNSFIIAKCQLMERRFTPHVCLRSRHVQTILSYFLPVPEVTYEREYLQMRDRGVVAIDWVTSPHVKLKRKPTVLLVLPSLSRGALSVSSICHNASLRGMQPVVINYRGHGGSVLTTAKLLSLGDPSDLRQVIKYIKLRMPKANLSAIAFGTGCGLLISYLGEFGSSALLTVAVCISPCYNEPFRFSSQLRSNYDLLLLLNLKALICRHAKALSSVFDVSKALSAWTFWDFHQALFGPLYGHTNLEDFWEMNNSIRDVDDISIPIMCINSRDDPVCRNCDIPYDLFRCYPNFLLILTQCGGHCGFWEGLPPTSWVDPLCLDYVETVIEFTTKPPQVNSSVLSHSGAGAAAGGGGGGGGVCNNRSTVGLSRRTYSNRSFSSSGRGNSNGGNTSKMSSTKTSLKRCRFTI